MLQRIDTFEKQATRWEAACVLSALPVVTHLDLDAEDFTRTPDPAILRIGCKEEITRVTLSSIVSPWVERTEADPAMWELVGPDCGKQFKIIFKGVNGAGGRRARRCNLSLKQANGDWETLESPTPSGPTSRLFISTDENRQTTTQARTSKHVLKILREILPEEKITYRRSDGVVKINWIDIAKITATSNEDIQVFWEVDNLPKFPGLEKDALVTALAATPAFGGSSSSGNWSR